jgi:hypothetical protein
MTKIFGTVPLLNLLRICKNNSMKILFAMDDQVHHFKVTGEITPPDLDLLKESLFRFFKSNPSFVVVDLSEIHLEASDLELQNVLTEIRTLGKSKKMNLAIALTDIEARLSRQKLLEGALLQQIELLKAKIDLREEIRKNIEELRLQNHSIRRSLEDQAKAAPSFEGPRLLSPLIEKLWSDR